MSLFFKFKLEKIVVKTKEALELRRLQKEKKKNWRSERKQKRAIEREELSLGNEEADFMNRDHVDESLSSIGACRQIVHAPLS